MGDFDVEFLAKERLVMNILEKYGPVLSMSETTEVLNCAKEFIYTITLADLPRLVKHGKGGTRFFVLDVVNYLIPAGGKKINEGFVYDYLFARYGAIIKGSELSKILRGTKVDAYSIPAKDLPLFQRVENGTKRYMLHDVVRYMSNKMFNSDRPEPKEKKALPSNEVSHV
jgi:hypothetical protein